MDRGFISVYDASKLLSDSGENALVLNRDKHTGQVKSSINRFDNPLGNKNGQRPRAIVDCNLFQFIVILKNIPYNILLKVTNKYMLFLKYIKKSI